MRIVHTLDTGRNATFRLSRLTLADGVPRFLTGARNGLDAIEANGVRYPYETNEGPNVVLEAAFRTEKNCLVDAATGFRYVTFEADAAHAILHAVATGLLRLENGLISGFWTFKRCRRGAAVALIPHSGRVLGPRAPKAAKNQAPADDAQGAPDLSDFIRTL